MLYSSKTIPVKFNTRQYFPSILGLKEQADLGLFYFKKADIFVKLTSIQSQGVAENHTHMLSMFTGSLNQNRATFS